MDPLLFKSKTEVLVAGGGPTGLVLALWLKRLGVHVRVFDKAAEAGTTSRALVVHARTLEFYRQFGMADELLKESLKFEAVNLWVAGRRLGRAAFGDIGGKVSPYPFMLVCPQDRHEQILIERLKKEGVQVERPIELTEFNETPEGVLCHLRHPDGRREACEASFLAGCDGARSTTREGLKCGFPGGTYDHLFYVADVEARGPVTNGELHVALDASDFLGVFPLCQRGNVRFVGTVQKEVSSQENLEWKDVSSRAMDWLGITVEKVNWFSTYRVHHRVADFFRKGRVFLLGDAAHIHSPVGGQGMNTGIGDAVNLSWKLAGVLRGTAPADTLDSYETERIAFARRLVKTTDQGFTFATENGALARFVRLRVLPWLLPLALRSVRTRSFIFRTFSQTKINYRACKLNSGKAGRIRGGDRLPWIKAEDGEDNFVPLRSLAWQVHVYGKADPETGAFCKKTGLQLYVRAWGSDAAEAGLTRDGIYLVRPDGYVAHAQGHPNPALLREVLNRWRPSPGP